MTGHANCHPPAFVVHEGFTVPDGTRLLVAELDAVGKEYPLAHEILAPILAYHVAEDLDAAVAAARSVSRLGGVGHTVGVWTDDADVVQRFVDEVPAGRVVLNQPATQGAIGGIYNRLSASLTLGTGSGGGNLTMDNVSVRHLLNRQRVLRRRENARWMSIDRATWRVRGSVRERSLRSARAGRPTGTGWFPN